MPPRAATQTTKSSRQVSNLMDSDESKVLYKYDRAKTKWSVMDILSLGQFYQFESYEVRLHMNNNSNNNTLLTPSTPSQPINTTVDLTSPLLSSTSTTSHSDDLAAMSPIKVNHLSPNALFDDMEQQQLYLQIQLAITNTFINALGALVPFLAGVVSFIFGWVPDVVDTNRSSLIIGAITAAAGAYTAWVNGVNEAAIKSDQNVKKCMIRLYDYCHDLLDEHHEAQRVDVLIKQEQQEEEKQKQQQQQLPQQPSQQQQAGGEGEAKSPQNQSGGVAGTEHRERPQ